MTPNPILRIRKESPGPRLPPRRPSPSLPSRKPPPPQRARPVRPIEKSVYDVLNLLSFKGQTVVAECWAPKEDLAPGTDPPPGGSPTPCPLLSGCQPSILCDWRWDQQSLIFATNFLNTHIVIAQQHGNGRAGSRCGAEPGPPPPPRVLPPRGLSLRRAHIFPCRPRRQPSIHMRLGLRSPKFDLCGQLPDHPHCRGTNARGRLPWRSFIPRTGLGPPPLRCRVGDSVQRALSEAELSSGAQVQSFMEQIETHDQPPTYFKTNGFTKIHQSIVDSYGIARSALPPPQAPPRGGGLSAGPLLAVMPCVQSNEKGFHLREAWAGQDTLCLTW